MWWLPALVFAASFAAVHLSYLMSAGAGQVPVCFPYIEGCCSISRAARQEPAIHLFRAVMIPVATAMAALWWLAGQWLQRAGDGRSAAWRWMVVIGVTGALALVLDATFLVTQGPAYDLLRRYGATIFFGFTALAEMLLAARLERLRRSGRSVAGAGSGRVMLVLIAVMLTLGLADIPVSALAASDGPENAIEWTFALVMTTWFAFLAAAWRRAGLTVRVIGSNRR